MHSLKCYYEDDIIISIQGQSIIKHINIENCTAIGSDYYTIMCFSNDIILESSNFAKNVATYLINGGNLRISKCFCDTKPEITGVIELADWITNTNFISVAFPYLRSNPYKKSTRAIRLVVFFILLSNEQ